MVRPDPKFVPSTSYDDLSPWPRTPRAGPPWSTCGRVPGPDADESRLAYLSDFTRPWLRVTRPDRRLGLDLEWDGRPLAARVVPAGGRRPERFPWYGSGYFLSLTPCTSWPAHGLHEARRVAESDPVDLARSHPDSYATLPCIPA